jgi:hypothetical protein
VPCGFFTFPFQVLCFAFFGGPIQTGESERNQLYLHFKIVRGILCFSVALGDFFYICGIGNLLCTVGNGAWESYLISICVQKRSLPSRATLLFVFVCLHLICVSLYKGGLRFYLRVLDNVCDLLDCSGIYICISFVSNNEWVCIDLPKI